MSTRTDRRPAPRGDQRRDALLQALDDHLRHAGEDGDDAGLDSIRVADLSRAAGVTRSAFYFYFENKAMAVAALTERMYDEAYAAAAHLDSDADPRDRVRATIETLFDAFERHQHLYRAMLEARATSSAVREMWDADRESFVPIVAESIVAERRRARRRRGPDPSALASVLLELNDRALERLARGGPVDRKELTDAVVHVWLSSIYGATS